MTTLNWRQKTLLASTGFLLTLMTYGWLTQAADAQFTSPPGQGTPKGTAGGGSRPTHPSVCLKNPNSRQLLLAMAPTQSVGLTSAVNPTVWIYVPTTTATTLEFSLFTQEKEGIYQTNLPVKAPGLLKVTLPFDLALTIDKPYYWTAALVCNPKRRTEDWVVGSWVQQRSPSPALQHQLARANAEQKVNLYLQSGFWYDALNTYLGLQQPTANPSRQIIWAKLLNVAGLNTLMPPQELLPIATPSLATQATR